MGCAGSRPALARFDKTDKSPKAVVSADGATCTGTSKTTPHKQFGLAVGLDIGGGWCVTCGSSIEQGSGEHKYAFELVKGGFEASVGLLAPYASRDKGPGSQLGGIGLVGSMPRLQSSPGSDPLGGLFSGLVSHVRSGYADLFFASHGGRPPQPSG